MVCWSAGRGGWASCTASTCTPWASPCRASIRSICLALGCPVKPCPLAAQRSCTFRPTSFSSVQFSAIYKVTHAYIYFCLFGLECFWCIIFFFRSLYSKFPAIQVVWCYIYRLNRYPSPVSRSRKHRLQSTQSRPVNHTLYTTHYIIINGELLKVQLNHI